MTSNLYRYILNGSHFHLLMFYTKRIAVPIGIHMLMNGSVVLTQVVGGDSIKKLQEQATFIFHLIF